MLERFIAALVTLKLMAFAAFVGSLAVVTQAEAQVSFGGGAKEKIAAPDPTVCTGENLVLSIGREHPEAMARIDAKADAIVHGSGHFFKLEKPGVAPSYLYGTMHVADDRATNLSEEVRARIAGADVVALEVKEIADPTALQAKLGGLVAQSFYLDGTTLSSKFDPATADAVKAAVAARSAVPWASAQRMKPWLLMSAMLVPACETAKKAAGEPIVDKLIADLAAQAGRELVGLETVESQIGTIAGLPEPVMLRALANVARMGDRADDVFETSVALYEAGETAKLWALMQDPVFDGGMETEAEREAGYAAFQASVIDERNATMVKSFEALADRGNAFAGVGALHLPGEKGMLKMMEARGWRVTALD